MNGILPQRDELMIENQNFFLSAGVWKAIAMYLSPSKLDFLFHFTDFEEDW